MQINYNFTYENVGQGLFYTGNIKGFEFVFDCGSEKRRYRDEAIKDYRNRTKKIDLLVISHFDSDHVNGLDDLLAGDMRVGTVIIPYYSPSFRLVLAIKNRNIMPHHSWYYSFLSDPVQYLLNKDVEKIIIVGGEPGGDGLPIKPILPANEGFDEKQVLGRKDNLPFKIIERIIDKDLREQIDKEEPEILKFVRNGSIDLLTHDSLFCVSDIWYFGFYNSQFEPSDIDAFIKCSKTEVKINSSNDIKEVIKDPKQRKKVVKCYRDNLHGNLNFTSLCMYHGPIGSSNAEFDFRHSGVPAISEFYEPGYYTFKVPYVGHIGQLLTGDMFLNDPDKVDDLACHFRHYLDQIIITLIPHHGSVRNWCDRILVELNNCQFWIASAGFSNKHSHPSLDVVTNILNHERTFSYCSELTKIDISGKVLYF